MPVVSAVKCLGRCSCPRSARRDRCPNPSRVSTGIRYHPLQFVEGPECRVAQAMAPRPAPTPASASVAATASTTHFTAAALPTRAWPPISASRLPSAAPAGLLLRAARGATASPRRPARPGGMSRPAPTDSGPPARPAAPGAMRGSRGEPARASTQPLASNSSAAGSWWTESRPARTAAVLPPAPGARPAWAGQAWTVVAASCSLPREPGPGRPRAPAGPRRAAARRPRRCPKLPKKRAKRPAQAMRRPGAAERTAARSRMRRGAFGSKRFILLDSRRLSQRRPGPVRCQRAIRNLALTGSE